MAKKYYAVKNGKSGDNIYQSWAECEAQVKGAPGVVFKGFATRAEAEAFLRRAGESPAEEPADLLAQLEEACGQLERLIACINRTNSATLVGGTPLSGLLARRDVWKKKLQILRDFLSSASELATRRTVGEIKIRSTVNVREMQKQLDAASKALRELDEAIQEANWTTELLEE